MIKVTKELNTSTFYWRKRHHMIIIWFHNMI